MNDRIDDSIALLKRHHVVRFSVITFLALIAATALWIVGTGVFDSFAVDRTSELSLAVASQQKPAVAEAIAVKTETQESAVAVQATDSRADAPRIDMIGESTINLVVGESYTDDGARAFDLEGNELAIRTYVDGELSEMVVIDTSSPDRHEIEYRTQNSEGLTSSVTRTIDVH